MQYRKSIMIYDVKNERIRERFGRTMSPVSVLRLIIVGMLLLVAMSVGCVNETPEPTGKPVDDPSSQQPTPQPTDGNNQPQETNFAPLDSPQRPARDFYMGALAIPGEGQSFKDVHAQVAQHAEFVPVWGRPSRFYERVEDHSGSWGKTFIDGYIRGNGMFPLVHLSFIEGGMTLVMPPGMENATLSDPQWRAAYKKAVIDIVRASKPKFISIGNEVNRWYEAHGSGSDNPNGFQHFVSLYEEIYDEMKDLSPETVVFCTFSREIVSENREADLSVLELFNPDMMDLLIVTSYPHAIQGIMRPDDIPDTYYSMISNYMPGKPFGFSEIAWPSLDVFGGEQAQADLLSQVTGRLTKEQGIDLYLVGWPWLHDLDENDYIGLVKRNGTEKLGYLKWKDISSSSN